LKPKLPVEGWTRVPAPRVLTNSNSRHTGSSSDERGETRQRPIVTPAIGRGLPSVMTPPNAMMSARAGDACARTTREAMTDNADTRMMTSSRAIVPDSGSRCPEGRPEKS
jgi:hypothetical protein